MTKTAVAHGASFWLVLSLAVPGEAMTLRTSPLKLGDWRGHIAFNHGERREPPKVIPKPEGF